MSYNKQSNRSNYMRIGDFIQLVDERNKDLKITTLLGLSISKQFIPSVANTVGTNMARYKIIRKNQFACSIMQVRRDKKMPVAILKDFDEAIISQAYPVFEVKDTSTLLPDYLMMWMSRSEFDRHACFLAVGGVRGSLEWEDFLNMELPIPSIEKQRAIVQEYQTITKRIQLNEQLNLKLEETAQAIYKHWFVDFEFPDENGKPYKSSGGEMVYKAELDIEVPLGWEVISIEELCVDMKSGSTPSRSIDTYWNEQYIPWIKTGELNNRIIINSEEYISELGYNNSSVKELPVNTVLIAMYGQGDTKGKIGYLRIKATTNQACCAMICENEKVSSYLYYHLRVNRNKIANLANGGAQPNLSKDLISKLNIYRPIKFLLEKTPFVDILKARENFERENLCLSKIQDLLLSKMSELNLKVTSLFPLLNSSLIENKQNGGLLIIENPESHLSISAQENLIQIFKNIDGYSRILIETHSPTIINSAGIDSLVLFSKDENETINIFTSSKDENLFRDKIIKELGIKPSYNLRDFHEKIVFVESHNDANFYDLICKVVLGKSLSDNEKILVLPFGGGANINTFLSIKYFHKSRRPLYLILDSDSQTNNQKKQQAKADNFEAKNKLGKAYVLKKSCIENYYHPKAIERYYNFPSNTFGQISDNENVKNKIKKYININNITKNIKHKNNHDLFASMTVNEWHEVLEPQLIAFLNKIVS